VEQLASLLEASARFVRDMKAGKPPRFLSLLGTSGAGKTMLARRVWRWFNAVGKFYKPIEGCDAEMVRTGQFCSWRGFMEECLRGDFSRTVDLCDDWFVVLDDIGAKRDKSGMGLDKLDTVLASRSEKKWTMITANQSLEELADMDSRISSRLLRGGSEAVEVKMLDYAIRQAAR
jgi:DNA replication protein DnaC